MHDNYHQVIDLTGDDSEEFSRPSTISHSSVRSIKNVSLQGQGAQRQDAPSAQDSTSSTLAHDLLSKDHLAGRTHSLASIRTNVINPNAPSMSLKAPGQASTYQQMTFGMAEMEVGHVSKKRRLGQPPVSIVGDRDRAYGSPVLGFKQNSAAKLRSSSPNATTGIVNVITGDMRAGDIGRARTSCSVRSNSPQQSMAPSKRIQKLNTSSSTVRVEERLAAIFHKQVMPHIKKAIHTYCESVSSEDRYEIKERVIWDLVKDPSFMKNFQTYGLALSSSYEIQVARKAETLVSRYTRDVLRGIKVLPHPSSLQSHNSPMSQYMDEVPRHSLEIAVPSVETHKLSSHESDTSSDIDDIFERHQARHSSALQQRSSFTPSTPISNGLEQSPDCDALAESTETHQESSLDERRRPERSTRTSQPRYVVPRRPRRWQKKPQDDASNPVSKSVSLATPPLEEPRLRSESNISANPQKPLQGRPYLSWSVRKALLRDWQARTTSETRAERGLDLPFSHIPFSDAEMELLIAFISRIKNATAVDNKDSVHQISFLMAGRRDQAKEFAGLVHYGPDGYALAQTLRGRNRASVAAFLKDATDGKILEYTSTNIQRLSASPQRPNHNAHLSNLLRQREVCGLEPSLVRHGGPSLRGHIASFMEDQIVHESEWTDCSSDIAALTWIGKDSFVAGALAHFDSYNMQYNKPGNLLVGSVSHDTLRAYPDHRILRPLVSTLENKDNALESMRTTQDPWLYAPVVSCAYSSISRLSFTSSYDHTVKVWEVPDDGLSMKLCGTWRHEARVNYVATSKHHSRVATASETYNQAIRIYKLDKDAVSQSAYDEYGGNKSEAQLDVSSKQRWAYQPATLQWARAESVANLLLVGYSPRSEYGDDSDIPEDKKNTGELCVWDYTDGTRYHVSASRTSNVFEAIWHPTQPLFVAATSPSGTFDSERTRTQVRLFALNDQLFTVIMTLDCPALDITELTIMPNCCMQAYVTASCTDGNTYVWDTAQGEDPIHVLGHGESIDNPDPNLSLEVTDGGVTFASWGASINRFYTGATDGRVKAWDVTRRPGLALVRTVLELSGPISSGAFREDFRKLLIGESGKVHLLGIDDGDIVDDDADWKSNNEGKGGPITFKASGILPRHMRRPKVIIPHPEPEPPESHSLKADDQNQSGYKLGNWLLEEGILEYHHSKGIFQGPNYGELGLFRVEAHEDHDGTKPLLPGIHATQQYLKRRTVKALDLPRLTIAKPAVVTDHKANEALDFVFERLTLQTQVELEEEEVDLDWDEPVYRFDTEITPRRKIFRIDGQKKHKREISKRKKFGREIRNEHTHDTDYLGHRSI